MQKAKWLSEEALQIAEKRREAKGKGEKERYTHLNAEFQRTERRDQCKEVSSSVINGKKSVQFSRSVMSDSLRPHGLHHARLPCPSLTPGLIQTHVHQVNDTIQPSHPLSSPSPPVFNLAQHQGLFQ